MNKINQVRQAIAFHLTPFSKTEHAAVLKYTDGMIKELSAGNQQKLKQMKGLQEKYLQNIPSQEMTASIPQAVNPFGEIVRFTQCLTRSLKDFGQTVDNPYEKKLILDVVSQLTAMQYITKLENKISREFCDFKKIISPYVIDESGKTDFHVTFNHDEFSQFRNKHRYYQKIKKIFDSAKAGNGSILLAFGTTASQVSHHGHVILTKVSDHDMRFYNSSTFGLLADVTEKNDGEKTFAKSTLTYAHSLPRKKNSRSEDVLSKSPWEILSTSNPPADREQRFLFSYGSQLRDNQVKNKKINAALQNTLLPHHLAEQIDFEKVNDQNLNPQGFIPQYPNAANCHATAPLQYVNAEIGEKLYLQFQSYITSSVYGDTPQGLAFKSMLSTDDIMTEKQKSKSQDNFKEAKKLQQTEGRYPLSQENLLYRYEKMTVRPLLR